MRSSSALFLALAALLVSGSAAAQQTPQGFGADRLYLSSPGGGWFVMDSLDLQGGLGGAMALTTGYARDSLVLRSSEGADRLALIRDQAIANFGFAATYDRFRLSLDIRMPLVIAGEDGTVAGVALTAPSVTVGGNPDTLGDARIGFDARILGAPDAPFRLGAGAQLFVPNGQRSDYLTDGTYRAMFRVLVAGDVAWFTYAAHVGTHVRPLDDSSQSWTPRGSELLFGVAAGPRAWVGSTHAYALAFGPEIYGATAFGSFFGGTTTALEALVSARLEGTGKEGPQMRVKLGGGGGLDPHFGEPAWRFVFGLEVFDHRIH